MHGYLGSGVATALATLARRGRGGSTPFALVRGLQRRSACLAQLDQFRSIRPKIGGFARLPSLRFFE
jgi:hypothetical protein